MKEELIECPICKELTNELFDTEGAINGSIGDCCKQCLIDFDIKI